MAGHRREDAGGPRAVPEDLGRRVVKVGGHRDRGLTNDPRTNAMTNGPIIKMESIKLEGKREPAQKTSSQNASYAIFIG